MKIVFTTTIEKTANLIKIEDILQFTGFLQFYHKFWLNKIYTAENC